MSSSAPDPLRGSGLAPADLHIALTGAVYPARPSELLAHARGNDAHELLLAALALLPDSPIVGPDQVCMAVFGRHAQTEGSP